MKYTQQEKQESLERLREWLKPGDTVYTILRHVSRSGMYRAISLVKIVDGQTIDLSWNAAKLLEGYDEKHQACRASGCGTDMGFHLVYNLSYRLFPQGYTCTGNDRDNNYCPANDHSNQPYPERDGKMHHSDGGYALRQKWL